MGQERCIIKPSEMILIVDDDPEFLEEVQVALAPIRAHGILFAETGSRAMDLIQRLSTEIAVVLIDLSLPDVNGFDLIRSVHREYPRITIMGISAYGDAAVTSSVIKLLGGDKMIKKPVMPGEWAEIAERVRRFRETYA